MTRKDSPLLDDLKQLIVTYKTTQAVEGGPGESGVRVAKGGPRITKKEYEEDEATEQMLIKLSKPRLCSIINALAKDTNTNLREFLSAYLQRKKGEDHKVIFYEGSDEVVF